MLLYFGVTPYLVFDGDNLPSKAGTEQDRHRKRQESRALGLELQRKGRLPEAYQEFQKAVDVTPYMARQLIEELKKLNVQYVVAPYEADAQLVYLEKQGIIQGIISEDSDLLVFGAKRLLSKLDQHGDCIEINRADFTACREVSLVGWSDANFRQMCILSGCDYLANIPKMGLKTAYRSIRKHKSVEKALRMLQFEGQFHVPADYLANFKQAELTFLYQRVFCPKGQKLATLNVPEDDVDLEELPFLGADVEAQVAAAVARGDLDPTTKEPIQMKPLVAGKLPLGISRRQTLGSSSELKPSKPINSFFTPKRTPLAELDPNSLTPSPSQQRLLERNANSSWQANSAPLRSSVARSPVVRTFSDQGQSPLVRSVERKPYLAQAVRASTLQPTKRQRLCSETEDDLLPTRPDFRSRFFNTSAEQGSPSEPKVTKIKKQRKSTLDVFSDEIAEDIFSNIPDPVSKTRPEKAQGGGSGTSIHDAEKNTAEVATKPPAKEEAPVSVQTKTVEPSSQDSEASSKFKEALEYHVQRQNSNIISRYAFQGDCRADPAAPRSSGTKFSVASPGNKPAAPSSPRTPGTATQSRIPQRQRLTPLQRMGHAALTRSHTIDFPTKLRQIDSPGSGRDESPDNAAPASVDGPMQGSEDMIVPRSDDEEEETCVSAKSTPLDLERFSFAAN